MAAHRALIRADDLLAKVAGALLAINPGDRLPTVRSLAAEYGVSIGSAQAAIARLEEVGAVDIESRGRRGSFLRQRVIGRLWFEANHEPLIAALPLPNTRHINGLATAMKSLFADSDVPSYFVFIRGSRQRLEALRQGRCHIAVVSALAAEERLPSETIVLELAAQTLVAEHRIYYIDRTGEPERGRRLRVILDPDSADFTRLAEIEFKGQNVEFVNGTYNQLNRLLREDRADAGVWDVEEDVGRLPPPVLNRPLSSHTLEILRERNTRATLVVRSDDEPVRHVVTAILRPPDVVRIQRQVIDGDRVAEY